MNYWSGTAGRMCSEAEFGSAIAAELRHAAPDGVIAARLTCAFADDHVRYALTYFGAVAGVRAVATSTALDRARELRAGRYRAGLGAALLTEISVDESGAVSIVHDDGWNGPIASDLLFPAWRYREDLARYPRRSPRWLSEYAGRDVPGDRPRRTGSDDIQGARDALWDSIGLRYEPLLALPPCPGRSCRARVVRRERTVVVATDGLSAAVGAEFFIEAVDSGLDGDDGVVDHWLYPVLGRVAAAASADLVDNIIGAQRPPLVEVGGILGPPEWVSDATVAVLLSTNAGAAPAGFETPIGAIALVTVTVLRAVEAAAVSAQPALAAELAERLRAVGMAHYFDPHRAPLC